MSNEVANTAYKTVVNAGYLYEGPDLETAIRIWDSESVTRTDIAGGIMVQSFNSEGVMVRDGWVLHVSVSGNIYLSPLVKGD